MNVAHLIRYGYVLPRQILLLYTPAIMDCQKVLVEQMRWLDQFRMDAGESLYYRHFQDLCKHRQILWDKGEGAFTDDRYERLVYLNPS